MTTWDGKERRKMNGDTEKILDRLGVIDVKIGIVETKVDGLHETNSLVKDELKEHSKVDHWLFGIIITILLAVLTQIFTKK